MMHRDGSYTLYLVQHSYPSYRGGTFVESDLGRFLFTGLSYEDKKGAKGDRYRALIDPIHECWQRTGVHGFLRLSDARPVLTALRELEPGDRELPAFRLVRRTIVQSTAVVT